MMEPVIAEQLAQRRLSTRDKNFKKGLNSELNSMPPEQPNPGAVAELLGAIQSQRDPKLRAMLQAELDKIRAFMQQNPNAFRDSQPRFQYPRLDLPMRQAPQRDPIMDKPHYEQPVYQPMPKARPVYES